MVKRSQPHRTSAAIAELQTALDMQEAAERLVASKLARLATLLSSAEPARSGQKRGPTLVVNNPLHRRAPLSDNAA
jgi:hypothetical protein